jgi:hypothetical protein
MIAIGVVCGFLGLVLGLLGAFCWLRARKRREGPRQVSVPMPEDTVQSHTEGSEERLAELYAAEKSPTTTAVKLPAAQKADISEIDGMPAQVQG